MEDDVLGSNEALSITRDSSPIQRLMAEVDATIRKVALLGRMYADIRFDRGDVTYLPVLMATIRDMGYTVVRPDENELVIRWG